MTLHTVRSASTLVLSPEAPLSRGSVHNPEPIIALTINESETRWTNSMTRRSTLKKTERRSSDDEHGDYSRSSVEKPRQ